MQVDPSASAATLRLVQPAQAVRNDAPVQPANRPLRVQRSSEDTYSFEAAYRSQLPRVQLTEAFYCLERIREQLVAAQTDLPMRFEDASTPVATANPYAAAYSKLQPADATANENATIHQIDESA